MSLMYFYLIGAILVLFVAIFYYLLRTGRIKIERK